METLHKILNWSPDLNSYRGLANNEVVHHAKWFTRDFKRVEVVVYVVAMNINGFYAFRFIVKEKDFYIYDETEATGMLFSSNISLSPVFCNIAIEQNMFVQCNAGRVASKTALIDLLIYVMSRNKGVLLGDFSRRLSGLVNAVSVCKVDVDVLYLIKNSKLVDKVCAFYKYNIPVNKEDICLECTVTFKKEYTPDNDKIINGLAIVYDELGLLF